MTAPAKPVLLTLAQLDQARLGLQHRVAYCAEQKADNPGNPFWQSEIDAANSAHVAVARAMLEGMKPQ